MPICYNQIVQLGDSTTNYQLMPGDRIYVASRSLLDSLNPFDQTSIGSLTDQFVDSLQCWRRLIALF